MFCLWTTGIHRHRGTSLLSPHANGLETHRSDTQPGVTPTHRPRGRDHSRHPRRPSSSKRDAASSHACCEPTRGCPFGGASGRGGCHRRPCPGAGLGAPAALLGAAAAIRRACSLPDPLHLTHFLFFTQLPADNKLSIRSPQEHLQLSSLSCTSAWPRTNSSSLNRSHMSHLQLFYCHNCPDLRGVLGN